MTSNTVTFDNEVATDRRVVYLCQDDAGNFYCVTSDLEGSRPSYKLFIGNGAFMAEVAVVHVSRYSSNEDSTTVIKTADGRTFYWPWSMSAGQYRPTWDGTKLHKLDPAKYEVVETVRGVESITLK